MLYEVILSYGFAKMQKFSNFFRFFVFFYALHVCMICMRLKVKRKRKTKKTENKVKPQISPPHLNYTVPCVMKAMEERSNKIYYKNKKMQWYRTMERMWYFVQW